MKVSVFGNELVKSDKYPAQLIPRLSKQFPAIEFIHVDPTENWYQNEKEIIILDTIVGIDKVTIFNSLDSFENHTKITPHDYDLYMDLQLLMKIGKVKNVTIIGIPVLVQSSSVYSNVKMVLEKALNE